MQVVFHAGLLILESERPYYILEYHNVYKHGFLRAAHSRNP